MYLGPALVMFYLLVGLTIAAVIGGVLDGNKRLPGKYERIALALEKRAMESGVDREMMLLALVLFWPAIFRSRS